MALRKGDIVTARRSGQDKEVVGFGARRSIVKLKDNETGKITAHQAATLKRNYVVDDA